MADPGFPRGGGANPQGGAPGYDFIKISQKLHEIKEKSAPRGDPPLSTNLGHTQKQLSWLVCTGITSWSDTHTKPTLPCYKEKRVKVNNGELRPWSQWTFLCSFTSKMNKTFGSKVARIIFTASFVTCLIRPTRSMILLVLERRSQSYEVKRADYK